MRTSEVISERLASNKVKVGSDALLRFSLTGLQADANASRVAERLIDALAVALRTKDAEAVRYWVDGAKGIAPAFHLRELAHATCMAVAAETAHFCRESFREVMSVLQKVEALIANLVRESEVLQAAA